MHVFHNQPPRTHIWDCTSGQHMRGHLSSSIILQPSLPDPALGNFFPLRFATKIKKEKGVMFLVDKILINKISAVLMGCFSVLKIPHYTLDILSWGFWCVLCSCHQFWDSFLPSLTPKCLWALQHLSRTPKNEEKTPKPPEQQGNIN